MTQIGPLTSKPRCAACEGTQSKRHEESGERLLPQIGDGSAGLSEDAAVVSLSSEASPSVPSRSGQPEGAVEPISPPDEQALQAEPAEKTRSGSAKSPDLSAEKQRAVDELKERDRQVRAHEQAHVAALGSYASGGAKFEFETGPDGKRYAVGGEVSLSVSPEEDPEKTIQKAQTIRRAALAPAEPSGQDRSVAAQASEMEANARAELMKRRSTGDGAEKASGPEMETKSAAEPAQKSSAPPDKDGVTAASGDSTFTEPKAAQTDAQTVVASKPPAGVSIYRAHTDRPETEGGAANPAISIDLSV